MRIRTLPRRAITLTELLAVIAIIVTLTSMSFFAFSSAKHFTQRQDSDVASAIARANVNSQVQKIAPPKPTVFRTTPLISTTIPRPVGCAKKVNYFNGQPYFVRFGGLELLQPRPITETLTEGVHFTAAPVVDRAGFEEQHFVGAVVAPEQWRTYVPADAFLLHSRKGSKRVIYLDFNGHTVSGTSWNTTFNDGNDIVMKEWDNDGKAGFSDPEKNMIILMWRYVAEDFAPFDVDVTTEDPGTSALIDEGGSDDAWGMRVLCGPIPTVSKPTAVAGIDWNKIGGIAGGNFKNTKDQCCFVFNGSNVGNKNPEWSLPGTVSHEVGHTLGLGHDGDSSKTAPNDEYYPGHTTSNGIFWGPIMGGVFGSSTKPIVLDQWSAGDYTNANNKQDDLATITGNSSRLSYRPDDHHGGDLNTSPTPLNAPLTGTLTETYGIIEKNIDVDIFLFYADPGSIDIKVEPFFAGPNLDPKVDLYDPSGNFVTSGTQANGQLASIFKMTLTTAGTYQLRISGQGRTPFGSNYSNYGSLGHYKITGTVTPLQPTIGTTNNTAKKGIRVAGTTVWRSLGSSNYEGFVTIGTFDSVTRSGTFQADIEMPDGMSSISLPTGTQSGRVHTATIIGTLSPTRPLTIRVRMVWSSKKAPPTRMTLTLTQLT